MSEQYDFVRKLREKQSLSGLEGSVEYIPVEDALYQELAEPLSPQPTLAVPPAPSLTPVSNFCGQCGQSLTGGHRHDRRHSRLGMAATLKAFLLGLLLLGSIIVAMVLPEETPDLWYSLIALVWMAVFSAAVLGMGISMPGLFRKNRHKLFPVMGLVFNGIIVGLIILLMLFCVACYIFYPEAGADENDYDFVRREMPVSVLTV